MYTLQSLFLGLFHGPGPTRSTKYTIFHTPYTVYLLLLCPRSPHTRPSKAVILPGTPSHRLLLWLLTLTQPQLTPPPHDPETVFNNFLLAICVSLPCITAFVYNETNTVHLQLDKTRQDIQYVSFNNIINMNTPNTYLLGTAIKPSITSKNHTGPPLLF